jgi:hypothetical protein
MVEMYTNSTTDARQGIPARDHQRERQPQGPTRLSLPTKISKTTPCKVAGGRQHGCFELSLQKHFDTSGKSAAELYRPAICKTPMALLSSGLFGAIARKKPLGRVRK